MCKGDSQEDVERRTMPADSKCLNSAFETSGFSDSRRQVFAKTGGLSAHVNVVLYSIGRFGHHITRAENGGNLANRVLISAGTESGMG